MTDLWMPGATHHDIGNHAPTDGGPAKAIGHITWDRNATAAKPAALVPYENLVAYFGTNPTGRGVAPHLLWDPFTGRVTQFLPADSRSLSLVDGPGGTRTNRAGKYVIQIEALFFPYCTVDNKTYAALTDTPLLGWDKLNAWTRSLGIPDTWPMGRPTSFAPNRSETVWETHAGWYGHQQVPENTHQDPGSWPAFVTPPTPHPVAQYAPFPGVAWFHTGRKSPIVAAMHARLVAVGCNHYQSAKNADVIGSGDVASYEAWQRKYSAQHHKGWTGSALKWPPGRETWDALKIPKP